MAKVSFIVLISMLCLFKASSADVLDSKIAGGKKRMKVSINNQTIPSFLGSFVPLSDAPFQAQLSSNNGGCAGAIIAPNAILTAAYCAVGQSASDIIVRVGTKFNARGGELFRVKNAVVFPRYNNITYDNDIAILQLEKNITLAPKVKEVIALPADGEIVADGTPVFVSGFGDTANDKDLNRMLRAVELKTVNLETCSRTYAGLSVQMICANTDEGGKAACKGLILNLDF